MCEYLQMFKDLFDRQKKQDKKNIYFFLLLLNKLKIWNHKINQIKSDTEQKKNILNFNFIPNSPLSHNQPGHTSPPLPLYPQNTFHLRTQFHSRQTSGSQIQQIF